MDDMEFPFWENVSSDQNIVEPAFRAVSLPAPQAAGDSCARNSLAISADEAFTLRNEREGAARLIPRPPVGQSAHRSWSELSAGDLPIASTHPDSEPWHVDWKKGCTVGVWLSVWLRTPAAVVSTPMSMARFGAHQERYELDSRARERVSGSRGLGLPYEIGQ